MLGVSGSILALWASYSFHWGYDDTFSINALHPPDTGVTESANFTL